MFDAQQARQKMATLAEQAKEHALTEIQEAVESAVDAGEEAIKVGLSHLKNTVEGAVLSKLSDLGFKVTTTKTLTGKTTHTVSW